MDDKTPKTLLLVVPYIGTWIETLLSVQQWRASDVVPYIGTWIETTCEPPFRTASNRRTLYRYVD